MRKKILDCAIALFLENGIEQVSTRDLTERLGISRSHIYHYFDNWRALSLEAVTRFLADEMETFETQLSSLTAEEKLRTFIESLISENLNSTRKLYTSLWLLSAIDESYQQIVHDFLEKWQGLLIKVIELGIEEGTFRKVDARRVARQIDAMSFGYCEYLLNPASKSTVKESREDIQDFVQKVLLNTQTKEQRNKKKA